LLVGEIIVIVSGQKLSSPIERAGDSAPLPGLGLDAQVGADGLGSFPDAEQAVRVSPPIGTDPEPDAVVFYNQFRCSVLTLPRDVDVLALRVLLGVHDRFLRDPPHLFFL
jgi:hypothetical protein